MRWNTRSTNRNSEKQKPPVFLLILVLCLFCIPSLAFALPSQAGDTTAITKSHAIENEASAALADSFFFRNGIVWGMSPDEVRSIEGEADHEDTEETYSVLGYDEVHVSNYSSELGYIFHKDRLVSALYGLERLEPEAFDYLSSAISSKYGSPIEADIFHLLTLTDTIDPDALEIYDLVNWQLEDGTYIALFSDEEEDGWYYLIYLDEKTLLQIRNTYNTEGL